MGCFTVNCGISHHGIYSDRIVGILLNKKEGRQDSLLYTDELYSPQFFPFRGTCDTYGRMVIDSNDNNLEKYLNYTKNPVDFESDELSWFFILEDVYDFILKTSNKEVKLFIKDSYKLPNLGVKKPLSL